jgi:hypothetical protein
MPNTKSIHATSFLTAITLGLLLAVGCSGNSKSQSATETALPKSQTSETQNVSSHSEPDPGIDLNCVYDRIQNPSESFHYVYKKDYPGSPTPSAPVDEEADITPQTIDGFFVNAMGRRPLHGVRSDMNSWQTAWSGLAGISGMSSTIALINHDSAMRRESDGGQVNGYNTIHYSIDTARFNSTEQQILGSTMGPGGFEKGDAWVTPEGCPVKLILDAELHNKDGSLLDKIHYEEAMVKK